MSERTYDEKEKEGTVTEGHHHNAPGSDWYRARNFITNKINSIVITIKCKMLAMHGSF